MKSLFCLGLLLAGTVLPSMAYLSRQQVDANVTGFKVINNTVIYVLGSDGKLWREYGNYLSRTQVDANVASFKALDGIYV